MDQTLNINIEDTKEVLCEECSNNTFIPGFFIRKASGFLTGTGKDTYMPLQVFTCGKCGHVNSEFFPRD